MPDLAQPLSQQVPIVGGDGTPTDYFIRMMKDFSSNAETDIQELLDGIGDDQGSILFRGEDDWEVLAPGTAGDFLQTQGAGADPVWTGIGGPSTPVVRDSSITSASALSHTINWPTGTVAGDLVLIFVGGVTAVASVGSFTLISNLTSSNFNGGVYAKEMTSGDISTGSVAVLMTGNNNTVIAAVTIDGDTVAGIRDAFAAVANVVASSAPVPAFNAQGPDLVLFFASNRAASNNTVATSGSPTQLETVNATNASGSLYSDDGANKAGIGATASFSVAGTGYYVASVSLIGPQ